ncbi:helix-turn-helix transcriptional regulator [Sphingomicrobium arenosum]|uniref:helix-turn-helix transcriptional regulator n=1 Tax=Sphingomicrobium arenosum TaxID=2233861 RepID=UPI00223FE56D|nr:helix-turn-helix transcriptional regulator [Sphingomicrobium arenosum]
MASNDSLDWIYEAAFDDDALDALAGRLMERFDSQHLLAGWIGADGDFRSLVAANYEADHLTRYFGEFAEKDIWLAAEMPYAGIERSIRSSDLVDQSVYQRSEIYNDFFRPTGLEVFHSLSLSANNRDGAGAWALHRARGRGDRDFTIEDREDIERIGGALRHVMKVRSRLVRERSGQKAFSLVSDRTRIGGVLLGPGGGLVQANRLGEDMLHIGDVIRLARGRVVASDEVADWFAGALRGIFSTATPHASSSHAHDARGRRIALTLSPVPTFMGMRAMLFLSMPVELGEGHDAALVDAFGLTRSEAQVMRLLANGGTAQGIAVRRGTSLQTVRVQLRHAMGKMGCTRQSEAIALAKRFLIAADPPDHTQFEV